MNAEKLTDEVIAASLRLGDELGRVSNDNDVENALASYTKRLNEIIKSHPGAIDDAKADELMKAMQAFIKRSDAGRPRPATFFGGDDKLDRVWDRVKEGAKETWEADTVREKIDAVKDTLSDIGDIVFED